MMMKAMTRQQLATLAGVDVRTLRNWIKPYESQLLSMGMPKGKGTIPPNVVKWIAEQYCIEIAP